MKTQALPHTLFTSSRLVYGCMNIGGKWSPDPLEADQLAVAREAVEAALETGITFFDHADIYANGKSETAFGRILADDPGLRNRILIQSKCGIRRDSDPAGAVARYDFSREHILKSVEGSLRRLKTDRLDLLLLHRPDALVEPEDVASAFEELRRGGKVLHFGVSNHSAAQIELLAATLTVPLVVNQVQVSLLHHGLITDGLNINQGGKPYGATTGLLDYCRLKGITVQAWSPVARGVLSRPLNPDETHLKPLADTAQAMAKAKGITVEALLLAWLLRHPAKIQPILGSTTPARIREMAEADRVELDRMEWYRLLEASRGRVA